MLFTQQHDSTITKIKSLSTCHPPVMTDCTTAGGHKPVIMHLLCTWQVLPTQSSYIKPIKCQAVTMWSLWANCRKVCRFTPKVARQPCCHVNRPMCCDIIMEEGKLAKYDPENIFWMPMCGRIREFGNHSGLGGVVIPAQHDNVIWEALSCNLHALLLLQSSPSIWFTACTSKPWIKWMVI